MAFPTAVNDTITDSVSQNAVSVLGQSGALAIGTSQQSSAQSAALLGQSVLGASENLNILRQAATNMAVVALYTNKADRL